MTPPLTQKEITQKRRRLEENYALSLILAEVLSLIVFTAIYFAYMTFCDGDMNSFYKSIFVGGFFLGIVITTFRLSWTYKTELEELNKKYPKKKNTLLFLNENSRDNKKTPGIFS